MSTETWTLSGLHAVVRFTVTADIEAGTLPRLLEAFAKRDLIPERVLAVRAGGELRVEIDTGSLPAEVVPVLEGNLRTVVGVRGVARRQEITGLVHRHAA